jgi:hypothetical protein
LDNTTLREQCPAVYSIVRHKGDTLAKVMGFSPLNVTIKRNLVGPRLAFVHCFKSCLLSTCRIALMSLAGI